MRAARTFPLLLSLLLLGGCSDGSPAGSGSRGELARSVDLGEIFRLSPGQRARVGNLVVVGFREVRQDSRCAIDVTCVWAGDAAAVLSVEIADAEATTLTLHTTLEPRAERVEDVVVTLVAVGPDPVSTRRIEPADYVVTLIVDRP